MSRVFVLAIVLGALLRGRTRKTPAPEKADTTFAVAEYTALRTSILKSTEIQQQIVNFTLIATGAFITLGGSQANIRGTFLFLHPILIFFLAIAWVDQDEWIGRTGRYLRRLEDRVEGLGWEHYLARLGALAATKRELIPDLAFTSARGVFVLTEVLLVGLGLLRSGLSPQEWLQTPLRSGGAPDEWLLLVAVVLTMLAVRRRRAVEAD